MIKRDYTGEETDYPPFPGFSDDAKGVMFQRKLLRIKEEYRDKPLPGRPETLVWEAYPIPEPDPTLIRAAAASPLYFRLAVMEYSLEHAQSLQTSPINYEVARVPGIGPEYRIATGPAPTMEEAMRRAEKCWLATFGGKETLPPLNPANDLDGREFKRDLQRAKARALRRQPKRSDYAGLKWVPGGHVPGTGEVRSVMAEYATASGLYSFFAAEFDMAHAEPGAPTIIWQIYLRLPKEDPEPVAQGCAPTFEEAMTRCETLFRIEINAKLPPENQK